MAKTCRPSLCLFLTKNDFKLTGRGTAFPLDVSEYTDDTAVIFDSRNVLTNFTPLVITHFSKFGMEVHVGDRNQPYKKLRFCLLLRQIGRILIQIPTMIEILHRSNLETKIHTNC